MAKKKKADKLLELTPRCDAIKDLYLFKTSLLSKHGKMLKSMGLHCLVRYFKYHKITYTKAHPYLLEFSRRHIGKAIDEANLGHLDEQIKMIWDDSPSQMPCVALNDLRASDGKPFCKNHCSAVRRPMYEALWHKTKPLKYVGWIWREDELDKFVAAKWTNGKYNLANAETGIGKTTAVLREIKKRDDMVLYLAPRQNLLREIKQKYVDLGGSEDDVMIYEGIDYSECKYQADIKDLMSRGLPYMKFCLRHCHYPSEDHSDFKNCMYHGQKKEAAFKKLLLMATPVLIDEGLFNRREFGNHKRPFVVIDEEHLEQRSRKIDIKIEDIENNYELLWGLVNTHQMSNLQPLVDLAAKLHNFLHEEHEFHVAPDLKLASNSKSIVQINKVKGKISNAIYEYSKIRPEFHSIFYDLLYLYEKGGTVYRRYNGKRTPHISYYQTLSYPKNKTYYFLDGAADISLYRHLFDKDKIDLLVEHEEIEPLQMFKGVEIIQYVEHSFSISSLKSKRRNKLSEAKEIIGAILKSEKYRNERVGIILKEKVEKELEEFIDEEFSDRDPRPLIKHFGDITGIDVFKDFKVGIITGMQNLSFADYAREVERLFGSYLTAEHEYKWTELLSTQDYTYKVKNPVFKDKRLQARFRQFCIGNAIQAVGRWRPYRPHGRDFCHIFLLNNYNTELPVRPVSKAQLLHFLGLPYTDAGSKNHVIQIMAHEIVTRKGCVRPKDIIDETEFNKGTVSNSLKEFANEMKWKKDGHSYCRQGVSR